MRKMLSTGWARRALLSTACVAILTSASGCATSPGPGSAPFCLLVGLPPAELIPAPGSPPGWVDTYLAVWSTECADGR